MKKKCLYKPEILKNNTEIVDFPCWGRNMYSIYFKQGNQSFRIADRLSKTEATWFRKMLAIALTNFAKDQIKL